MDYYDQVVCSNCGRTFFLEIVGGVYNPNACQNCGKVIDHVERTVASAIDTAFVNCTN